MDYEQKYKEALEKARQLCAYPTTNFKSDLEDIFPELKESEDEKIRKAILSGMNFLSGIQGRETFGDIPIHKCIAWLEKQKPIEEQKYWTEKEIEPIISDYLCGREHYGGMIGRLRCLKPKQKPKWSENDERVSDKTIELLEYFINYAPEFRRPAIRRSIDWLNSLKQRMEE